MNERTIVLKSRAGHYQEGVLDTAALPGEVVTLQADGKYDRLTQTQAEFLKGAGGSLTIVREDSLQGKTVLDAYAIGDLAFLFKPLPGDHIGVLVASGVNVTVGDLLIPVGGGNGKFTEAAGTETRYVVKALETLGALVADSLVKVEVISA